MLQILMTTSAAVVMNVSARVQSTEYIPAADPAWEEGAPLYGGEGGVMRLVGPEEDPGLGTVSRTLPGDSLSPVLWSTDGHDPPEQALHSFLIQQ